MDPNIMKFLEEDEDETMHSGADVEAFTAELNRDIEGDASTSQQQQSDSGTALSQGSSQSHFLQQWQTSTHDGIDNFQSGQDLMAMEEKEQHSSQVDMQKHGSDSQNREEDGNSSHEPTFFRQQPLDDQSTFPLSQPMVTQTSEEQPINIQGQDHEPKPEKEPQMDKVQNIGHHPLMSMGSNDQQPSPIEFKDQHSLSTSQGNEHTNMGLSSEQVMTPVNQHVSGMMMSSQQASGMNNQQSMSNSSQQAGSTLKLNKQVPFGMLLPIIQPQLDKDRAMQLHTLYFKLKKNEISKDGFVRHMRSIVGDHMLKMAVYKLQTQAARNPQTVSNQFQSQPQAPARQMQVPSSAQLPTDLSNSTNDTSAAKSREVENQADSQGIQVSQMSNSSSGALGHERKHPAFQQGLSKQQHMQFPQTSFSTYGNAGSSYSPFSATNAATSTSIRPHSHDSQIRQAPSHPNMAVNHLGPTPRAMNMTNMSKFERPHALSDPKKMPPGSLTHMSSNIALQQNQVSSMTLVKQEPDQSNEQHKGQLSSSHGLSSLSPPVKLGGAASGNLKDESFEIQSSRTGPTLPTSLVPANSVSSAAPSLMETNVMSNSRMPSLTSPVGAGINFKTPLKKPLGGQKKPMETPGSSPPSSKKQKMSGAFSDQSIEHLNDVTAVSGVNLREEEEQLFSGPKEDSRVSEASRQVVQEEEDRLILQKIPLQKKVMEIMAKCGLKNMSNDVEKCLSLCVEERMRGLISNMIRLSKQRVDIEKPRHKTIITSDVRQQIMTINRKAHEEWEKKQAESEKLKKLNDPESSTGVDGDKEKDESRGKSTKVNKEEDDKMRTTAANVAMRAATGVGDAFSRWQLMAAEKNKQGGSDSGPQTSKDLGRKQVSTSNRNTRENQDSEKRESSGAFSNHASVRKVGRNQVVVPRVARSISVKDVIAVLEREPQMSKSMLLYRLYQKGSADATGE